MGWGEIFKGAGEIIAETISKDLSDKKWADWAMLPLGTSTGDVLRASGKTVVAPLQSGMRGDNGVAFWAYFDEGDREWRIDVKRGFDMVVGPAMVNMSRRGTRIDEGPGGTGMTGTTGTTGGTTEPFPEIDEQMMTPGGFVFGRTRPRLIQQRRCPKGMRLARDGWCYPTKILPKGWRENQEKIAPVSWSDANHMRKGRAASKRVQKFAKMAADDAKELAPPRPRQPSAEKIAEKVLKMLPRGRK